MLSLQPASCLSFTPITHLSLSLNQQFSIHFSVTQVASSIGIIRCQQGHAWPRLFQPICTPDLLPAIFPRSGPALDVILIVTTYIPDNAVPGPNEMVYFSTIESLTLILQTITTSPEVNKTPSQSLLLYFVKWFFLATPIHYTFIYAQPQSTSCNGILVRGSGVRVIQCDDRLVLDAREASIYGSTGYSVSG
jgi:hypothetical protein